MTDRAAPSSDRHALRALAGRLRPAAAPRAAAPPPAFVRLAAPSPTPVATIAPRALPAPPVDLAGSSGWARLIDWCVADLGVDAAILSDDRGLVIASAGRVELDDAQGIAARLVIVFHQADRMSADRAPSVAIQLARGWLTGVRIAHGDEPVTLGVIAALPLDAAVRDLLAAAIAHKLREA